MEKKPKDIPPPQENETPFQRFERLAKKVVGVPKNAMRKNSKAKKSNTHLA